MTQAGQALTQRRLANWRQTPETRIAGDEEAPELIDRLGIITLYPASPEVPNLYHAYIGFYHNTLKNRFSLTFDVAGWQDRGSRLW
jgi:hypothetical protein